MIWDCTYCTLSLAKYASVHDWGAQRWATMHLLGYIDKRTQIQLTPRAVLCWIIQFCTLYFIYIEQKVGGQKNLDILWKFLKDLPNIVGK